MPKKKVPTQWERDKQQLARWKLALSSILETEPCAMRDIQVAAIQSMIDEFEKLVSRK